MSQIQTQIQWNPIVLEKYKKMISKIPIFHRELAKQVVEKKAPQLASERKASEVEEQDVIQAFLTEVPLAFYSLMIRLMDEVGFDHEKYESK